MNRGQALIDPSVPVYPLSPDNINGDLIVYADSKMVDSEGRVFQMKRHLGAGHFGQVYKVILSTSDGAVPEKLAMKISRSDTNSVAQFQYESQVLAYLVEARFSAVVSFFRSTFVHRGHICLVFALMGPSVLDLLKARSFEGFDFSQIQSILREVLKSVSSLSHLGLIHSDIKPENILFRSKQSSEVALIDYGSCCVVGDPNFTYIQSRYYRAPEIVLSAPIDTRADIWSIGCLAAELLLGLPLFPAISQVHLLVLMEEMLGPFPREISRLSDYFMPDGELKSAEKLREEFGEDFSEFQPYFVERGLDRIVLSMLELDHGALGEDNTMAFLDLLHKLLEYDPAQRISASEALAHRFFQLQFSGA
jgi:dual specificity protein kinase YAK1